MEWSTLLCEDRIRSLVKRPTGTDLRTEFEKDYHRIFIGEIVEVLKKN